MDLVGYRGTPPYSDYDRTFLPRLPTKTKNREMDECREALRTSSEVYGKFWVDSEHTTTTQSPTVAQSPAHRGLTDPAASRPHQQPRRCSRSLPNFPYVC